MSTTKPRHNLSNVDLERRTATCAVCGETQVYVGYDRRANQFTYGCINRAKANALTYRQRLQEEKLQDPNWKPRHRVTQVNVETMTGICAICGLTKVYKSSGHHKKYVIYLCNKKRVADYRKNRPKQNVPRQRPYKSSVMSLMQESQNKISVDKFKVERGCENCGSNADPLELELHFSNVDEQRFTMSQLVHFTPKRLRHLLLICTVYCVRCHPLIHRGIISLEPSSAVSLTTSE